MTLGRRSLKRGDRHHAILPQSHPTIPCHLVIDAMPMRACGQAARPMTTPTSQYRNVSITRATKSVPHSPSENRMEGC